VRVAKRTPVPSWRRVGAILFGLALGVASCTSTGSSNPAGGGFLRVGSIYPMQTFNPFSDVSSFNYFFYVYPTLVQYGALGEAVPEFARSWDRSSDGLIWTFHTVANAVWSDGRPLTAGDAAWTIQTVLRFKDRAAFLAGSVDHVAGATAPDATTLVIRYAVPVSNVLSQLSFLPILPEHVWATYATGDGKSLLSFKNPPPVVSGGPFTVTKFDQDVITVFQRNPHYYGRSALLEGMGIQYFSDEDAKIQAFLHHELDDVDEVPPTAVATLQKAGLIVTHAPFAAFDYLGFNSNRNKPQHRELLDPAVRLAFDHAIDREEIVKVAWLGFAQPGASIVPAAAGRWSDPDLQPVSFDPALANHLLDQAGYSRGADGVRMAGDHQMKYQAIDIGIGGYNQREFDLLKQDLQRIGVVIEQRKVDTAAGVDLIGAPDGKYLTNDLQTGMWGFPTDPGFILSQFTCGFGTADYCDPTYQGLYRRQGSVQSEDERRRIVWQMQRVIGEARPFIVIDYPMDLEAHSSDWAGFETNTILLISKAWVTGIHHR
jgi:peptide/nickel transport system substrate-binding protein